MLMVGAPAPASNAITLEEAPFGMSSNGVNVI
jgi:hypothetical protein